MIRPAKRTDLPAWIEMRRELYPETSESNHELEMTDILSNFERTACLLAIVDKEAVGFIEVSIRDWAEGCATKDVGYVESIIVCSGHRRRGIAKALLAAAEDWARDRGAVEMASDVDFDNDASLAWHTRAGFEEVGRSVLFKKNL